MKLTAIAGTMVLAAISLTAPAGAEPQQPPMPNPEETAIAPEAPASRGNVARAQFAVAVIDREPTEAIDRLTSEHDRVFFFTELHRFQGEELVHRWELDGEVKAEVPFGIDGPRWRVYSSKELDPSWLGPGADGDAAPVPPGPAAPAPPIE
jgi:hypothetical protein